MIPDSMVAGTLLLDCPLHGWPREPTDTVHLYLYLCCVKSKTARKDSHLVKDSNSSQAQYQIPIPIILNTIVDHLQVSLLLVFIAIASTTATTLPLLAEGSADPPGIVLRAGAEALVLPECAEIGTI